MTHKKFLGDVNLCLYGHLNSIKKHLHKKAESFTQVLTLLHVCILQYREKARFTFVLNNIRQTKFINKKK